MGIFTIITFLVTINLFRAQNTASIESTVTVLVADLKQQQLKAMIGDTEGRLTSDQYGIHFDAGKYVLFHGSYNSSEVSNFPVNLEGALNFGTSGEIIFAKGSGESSGLSTIILRDGVTNQQKTINTNLYGAISSIN